MSKELTAFTKICKNLNGYEFTDEYKKNKEIIESTLKALEIIKAIVKLYPITCRALINCTSKEEQDILKKVLL